MKITNKFIKNLRYVLLSIFLIIITVETYLHQILGGDKAASIHALCPYGAMESLYSIIFSGTLIQKIFSGTIIIFVVIILIALIFRRSFCGLICPFGALQELFGIVGNKLFKKRFIIPYKIDKPLRYLKYIVLILTVYFAWTTAGLWMDPYDPWAAYGHISTGFESLIDEYLIGLIILIITLVGSMLYDRFFCKYICPMGAFYGIISKISPSKITRNEDKCINCNLCSKNCPVNIEVSKLKEIKTSECINCQKCILSCPKENVLEFKIKDKTLKPLAVIIAVIIIFFGGIGITKIIGIYETTPAPITSNSKITVDEIKGYMTIENVATGLNMELDEVYKKLNIPTTIPKETRLKEISNYLPGFETENAKEALE